jgi:hypothetical protein
VDTIVGVCAGVGLVVVVDGCGASALGPGRALTGGHGGKSGGAGCLASVARVQCASYDACAAPSPLRPSSSTRTPPVLSSYDGTDTLIMPSADDHAGPMFDMPASHPLDGPGALDPLQLLVHADHLAHGGTGGGPLPKQEDAADWAALSASLWAAAEHGGDYALDAHAQPLPMKPHPAHDAPMPFDALDLDLGLAPGFGFDPFALDLSAADFPLHAPAHAYGPPTPLDAAFSFGPGLAPAPPARRLSVTSSASSSGASLSPVLEHASVSSASSVHGNSPAAPAPAPRAHDELAALVRQLVGDAGAAFGLAGAAAPHGFDGTLRARVCPVPPRADAATLQRCRRS